MIRPMRVEDVAAVQVVEHAAGELFRSLPDPRLAACADHASMTGDELVELVEDGRAWVAEDADRVVGFLAVRVLDGCAHVEEVSVDPAHGRRGHATALLREVVAWALATGLPAVTLTTFRDVPWNRAFYERRGFEVVPDGELSPVLDGLLDQEDEAHGLARELRVVMRLGVDAAPPAG